ncbi:hypothetical protein MLD38_012000 [Melastoma candidum]|uniref:Uncharacterized protein n=1 Tax=Melastoma candidum TaxID=119954 RepID=A0ACB9R5Z3_9MYRT|nr:hypothetical protein MLD38_012000 [Melastoma candidum]
MAGPAFVSFAMHLIQRSSETRLPEGPYSAASPTIDPKHLPRGHLICFSVSNFECFDKGIQTFQRSLPTGKVKQVFFFD